MISDKNFFLYKSTLNQVTPMNVLNLTLGHNLNIAGTGLPDNATAQIYVLCLSLSHKILRQLSYITM